MNIKWQDIYEATKHLDFLTDNPQKLATKDDVILPFTRLLIRDRDHFMDGIFDAIASDQSLGELFYCMGNIDNEVQQIKDCPSATNGHSVSVPAMDMLNIGRVFVNGWRDSCYQTATKHASDYYDMAKDAHQRHHQGLEAA